LGTNHADSQPGCVGGHSGFRQQYRRPSVYEGMAAGANQVPTSTAAPLWQTLSCHPNRRMGVALALGETVEDRPPTRENLRQQQIRLME
jgi:hypothetical protein